MPIQILRIYYYICQVGTWIRNCFSKRSHGISFLVSTSIKWFYHRFYDFEGHKKHQFLYAQPLISAPALLLGKSFLCNLNIGLLLPDRFCSGLFFAWPIRLSGPLHVWIPFYLFKVAISPWTTAKLSNVT